MGVFILWLIAMFAGFAVVGIYEAIALVTPLPTWSSMIRVIIAHFEPTRTAMHDAEAKKMAK
jgi:hypothetical protein